MNLQSRTPKFVLDHAQIWHMKTIRRSTGQKFYQTMFGIGRSTQASRKKHRTATEAEDYGHRVIARWQRLAAAAERVMEQA